MSDDGVTELYRNRLTLCLGKVPDGVNNGSWQMAIKFKEWAVKSTKAIKKTRVKQQELVSLINQYEGFK